ncbi:hypothetical protein EPN83_01540 [Patescibacteria group bacterium]|nr:MAG: hypothetical protein EPN83_01540 [Patescibacteria group bacterium]
MTNTRQRAVVKLAPLFLFILSLLFLPFVSSAQTLTEQRIADQETKLRAEYDALQKEIEKWQGILTETQKKASTLQGDISFLNAKIKEAELTIKAKNIAIGQLAKEIGVKTKKIGELEGKLARGRQSLAELIRKTNELDSYSLPEAILTNKDLSEFFKDFDSYLSIKSALQEHFAEVRQVKKQTEAEREQLDVKKNQETDAKYVVESRKKVIGQSQKEKTQLLTVTKQEEKTYQTVLAERQKRAAQIRAALFRLRDTEGIPFGKALEYAGLASSKTGVRPALILAILSQESDLGKNQGSCILSSLTTGDGVGKNTGTFFEKVMKAPRDTEPFENITKQLGREWTLTPVSCPPGTTYSTSRGYGGGMGPSQFIPSTWELFKERIGSIIGLGADSLDPWNPEHSFVATAIYLSDLGAAGDGYSAERNAACKYYSGASCRAGRKPPNVFYGDSVMQKAEEIQSNIDFLKGV